MLGRQVVVGEDGLSHTRGEMVFRHHSQLYVRDWLAGEPSTCRRRGREFVDDAQVSTYATDRTPADTRSSGNCLVDRSTLRRQ